MYPQPHKQNSWFQDPSCSVVFSIDTVLLGFLIKNGWSREALSVHSPPSDADNSLMSAYSSAHAHLCLQEQHAGLGKRGQDCNRSLGSSTSRGTNWAGVTYERWVLWSRCGYPAKPDVCDSHNQVEFSCLVEKDAGNRFKDVLYFLTGLKWLVS